MALSVVCYSYWADGKTMLKDNMYSRTPFKVEKNSASKEFWTQSDSLESHG